MTRFNFLLFFVSSILVLGWVAAETVGREGTNLLVAAIYVLALAIYGEVRDNE